MYQPFELFVGLRYTRAKRRNHFISFISMSSMLGITLGVTALITVMSVMNGFEKEVRDRILDMVSHLTITHYDNRMENWQKAARVVEGHEQVTGVAPYVEGQGMLINGRNVNGSLVRGVLPDMEARVSNIAAHIDQGSWQDLKPGEYGIVLGRDLARILGVEVGEKVTLVTPSANVTPAGVMPRLKRFTVVATFYIGMYEYDSSLAVMHMQDAQKLFRLGDKVTGVRVQLKDLFMAQQLRRQWQDDERLLGYWLRDWSSYHANWFRAVKIEKRMIFLLLTLIIAVAAFNIVSTLVMLVTDKQSDIAILRTLGASPRSVLAIFMIQGTFIGIIGTTLGVLGGIALATNLDVVVPFIENLFGFRVLDPSVYYISEMPSELHWSDVWGITLVSLLLGVVSTLYPAWRASRTQPAEALRYE
ncbi:MAG: lipoprotein-releasing ABC transporter permease subunit [Thioalkalispiraceae bacterium]|jgi:lipoprotein-releasing system permease protein